MSPIPVPASYASTSASRDWSIRDATGRHPEGHALSVAAATMAGMDDIVVRAAPTDGVVRFWCEGIRAQLAAWVPRLLGVHVRDRPHGLRDLALLLEAVADAADCTGLPGDADTARHELREAAVHATVAVGESTGADLWAELVAVRAGCRRAAVAAGVRIPVE